MRYDPRGIEKLIQDAQKEGKFDDLACKGQRLQVGFGDLASVANEVIRDNGIVPEWIELGRAIDRLDTDLTRVNFARAEIGSRLQGLDVIKTRLEDENVQLQTALSAEIDVDLIEAISQLTARQYALQASLQTAANILNLSLLDYI